MRDQAVSRTCSVESAASQLGISRSLAYRLAREDRLPVRILRIGKLYRVPRAELSRVLGETPNVVELL